ncbi:MAG: hypothetical protein ACPHK8_07170 [Thermoplasmatota archaeon]
MNIRQLTNLYVDAKNQLEQDNPVKKQKAVEGISLGDEIVRDWGIITFMSGLLFAMIAIVPPPLHSAYDMTQPPTFVKPDWYLLWSLGPIFLAKYPIAIGDTILVDTKFLGTILVNVAFVFIIAIPFVAGRGRTKRPAESPMNVAAGIFGLAFIWWMSVVGIADVIFAYEVKTAHGMLNWAFQSGLTPSPSELIDLLGLLSLHQTLLLSFLGFWAIKRHRPRYESKLNATYYKVR